MPDKLWKVVEEWRNKGAAVTDEMADDVYRFCLRKMEAAKVENPDEYINLLYPDEIKNHLFRLSVNATTILRKIGMEDDINVCSLHEFSLPPAVS